MSDLLSDLGSSKGLTPEEIENNFAMFIDEIMADNIIYDHWNSTLEFMAGNSPTWEKRNEQ